MGKKCYKNALLKVREKFFGKFSIMYLFFFVLFVILINKKDLI